MKNKVLLLISNALLLVLWVTAQSQQPPKPPNTEEKLKHVSELINKEITLTAAQKAKVESAYKDFFADIEKLRAKGSKKEAMPPPPPPPPPGSKEDMEKLSQARDLKIKASLNEAQYKKYTEIEKTLRPPRPGEGPGKQGPPPSDKK